MKLSHVWGSSETFPLGNVLGLSQWESFKDSLGNVSGLPQWESFKDSHVWGSPETFPEGIFQNIPTDFVGMFRDFPSGNLLKIPTSGEGVRPGGRGGGVPQKSNDE